jgi:hypothetical protein
VTVEVLAILLTLVAHVLGALVLIHTMMDGERIDWRSLWPHDDDDDGGGPWFDGADDDGPDGGGGVLAPLPRDGTSPSPVRLREPRRISEDYPRPTRRPEHAPQRVPTRPASRP